MKKIIVLLLLFTAYHGVNGQATNAMDQTKKKSKFEKIVIQTSGDCHSCKEKIENGLAFEKGIKDVEYDIETSKVMVVYNTKRTNPDNIRLFINSLGYDADDRKAEKKTHSHHSKH
ncbi:MAG: heavy-metal-associated domain-containing protein [Bacteroidales bacterium]|nr:heavy-metal-associated domain-containing protein [Bacteroidales bacterium]